MPAPRPLSEQPDPNHEQPQCPGCHDSAFVTREVVVTGGTPVAFFTCSSCLRSWPAPPPRMVRADLKPGK